MISEIERGRSCEAVVPLPPGELLVAGDTILFALSQSRGGQPAAYVKGGDSVLVSLTAVIELGTTDPATGQALVRLVWDPLGQPQAPTLGLSSKPALKSRGTRGRA